MQIQTQIGVNWDMDQTFSDSDQTPHLVKRASDGDQEALNQLMEQYRSRLHRMIALRMHPRLQGRVDASDVVPDSAADDPPAEVQGPRFLYIYLKPAGVALKQLY